MLVLRLFVNKILEEQIIEISLKRLKTASTGSRDNISNHSCILIY